MRGINQRLRVVHIPQVPMNGFVVEVKNEREAFLVENTLAEQHLFLYENNVIPDYSNAIFIEMWDEGSEPDVNGDKWSDYYNDNHMMTWDELKEEFINELK